MAEPGDQPLAAAYDVALLDLDGVVYVGPAAVPGAAEALGRAAELGMRTAFVTNNAARPPEVVAGHLRELGIAADAREVVTSAQAAARVVAGLVPPGSRVLVVGGPGLVEALRERDLVPVVSADDDPVAVVQGYSPDVGWRNLAEGTYALDRGLPWVASNTDLTIPTPRGRAPGNGTLVQVLRTATGRVPLVAGKPETPMHREAMLRSGARRPLVVGDRLDTDIEGAVRAHVDSLLVLTGVTGPREAVLAPAGLRPTYLAEDLGGLLAPVSALSVAAGSVVAGGWRASWRDGRVVLDREGTRTPRLDALRALCGLLWGGGEPSRPDGRGQPAGLDAALRDAGF